MEKMFAIFFYKRSAIRTFIDRKYRLEQELLADIALVKICRYFVICGFAFDWD